MAKREVTLSAEQWQVVVDLVGQAPVGGSTSEQAKRLGLYRFLERKAKLAEGLAYTVPMTPGLCRATITSLESPGIQYLARGLAEVWRIKEAFGWTPPDLDLYDDDDDEGEE